MNTDELVEIARNILTEEPDARRFTREKIRALIPVAISELQEKILLAARAGFGMGNLQAFVIETGDIDVVDGVADLTTQIDATGLRLDLIKASNILVNYTENPFIKTVQFVSSLDRLTLGGIQDKFFILAFLDGQLLRFRDPDGGGDPTITLNTTIKIRGVCTPSTVAQISNDQRGILANVLADVARREVPQPEIGVNVVP